MHGLDQQKYKLDDIFEKRRVAPSVQMLLRTYHQNLTEVLDQEGLPWTARTHIVGLTYFCDERHAFMFVDVRQNFISIRCFTGDSQIGGLQKGIWLNRGDNMGSETYRIVDEVSLERAVLFGVAAHRIASKRARAVDDGSSVLSGSPASKPSSAPTVDPQPSSTQPPAPPTGNATTVSTRQAERIICHAVKTTEWRWRQYTKHWRDIDQIFLQHGYEQQGFEMFKFAPLIDKHGCYSIAALGGILREDESTAYDRQYAGGFESPFYAALQRGERGKAGRSLHAAIVEFHESGVGRPGRFFWRLIWHMLVSCRYLSDHHGGSFRQYILEKFGSFIGKTSATDEELLTASPTHWSAFLRKMQPWKPLHGMGPNVFDFLFGDIVEGQFANASYKLDSANEHFLRVTGIAELIGELERDRVIEFLRTLETGYTLRQLNMGLYTYCSRTESEHFGFCRSLSDCHERCGVSDICAKRIGG